MWKIGATKETFIGRSWKKGERSNINIETVEGKQHQK